jgi:hypothetical protein
MSAKILLSPLVGDVTPIGAIAKTAGEALKLATTVVAAEELQAERNNIAPVQDAAAKNAGLQEQARIVNDEADAEKNPTPENLQKLREDSSGVPLG